MSDFQTDIHKLAAKIAEDALKDGVSLQDRGDVMKILTPYYALWLKRLVSDDEEPATFEEAIDRARSAGPLKDPVNGGTSAISIGRRAGPR